MTVSSGTFLGKRMAAHNPDEVMKQYVISTVRGYLQQLQAGREGYVCCCKGNGEPHQNVLDEYDREILNCMRAIEWLGLALNGRDCLEPEERPAPYTANQLRLF